MDAELSELRADVSDYVAEHGTKPRGERRWVFEFTDASGSKHRWGMTGMYGNAHRYARHVAKIVGAVSFTIRP